jgi:hypothetical protein
MKRNIIIQNAYCENEEKEFNYNYLNNINNNVNKSNIGLFNIAQNSNKVIVDNSFFTFDSLGETNTKNINYIFSNDFITIQKDMFLNIIFSVNSITSFGFTITILKNGLNFANNEINSLTSSNAQITLSCNVLCSAGSQIQIKNNSDGDIALTGKNSASVSIFSILI